MKQNWVKMIGNDIVDLALAKTESNWKRSGFLDKIFNETEQMQILNATNPEVMVWILWSRKEASYKIFNRITQIRAYNPLRFECAQSKITEGVIYGKVVYKKMIFYTKTTIDSDCIHTVAVQDASIFENLKIYSQNSHCISFENKIIKNSKRVPFLMNCKTSEKKPVSISHHGRFCFYVST